METNIPIEQVMAGKPDAKAKHLNRTQNKTAPKSKTETFPNGEERNRLTELDNGPMMSTSEILDFASGIDSTEYDQP